MTEQQGPYALEGVTCDCCASGGKRCTVEPESGAYICEDCVVFHERAVGAACRAIAEAYADHGGLEKDVTFVPDAARSAVKAYCEFTDEPITQEVD